MTDPSESSDKRPYGCTLALAIGFVTVAGAHTFHALTTGAPLNLSEEWGNLLFWMLLATAPFVLLDAVGVRGRWSWGAALAATLLFWAFFMASAYISGRDGTGVNFGAGILMLFSPVFVAAAGLAAGKLAKEM